MQRYGDFGLIPRISLILVGVVATGGVICDKAGEEGLECVVGTSYGSGSNSGSLAIMGSNS